MLIICSNQRDQNVNECVYISGLCLVTILAVLWRQSGGLSADTLDSLKSHNIHHESITISHFIEYLHFKESHNIQKCCYVSVCVPHHLSPSLYTLSFHQWANGGLDNVCHVSCVASCSSFIT